MGSCAGRALLFPSRSIGAWANVDEGRGCSRESSSVFRSVRRLDDFFSNLPVVVGVLRRGGTRSGALGQARGKGRDLCASSIT